VRLDQLRSVVLLGATGLLLAGCGSSALTGQPSTNSAEQNGAAAPIMSPNDAFTSAVTKLRLIAQDGCQTSPADQVYPNCDRFLAELRSAASTIKNNAPGLPGDVPMAKTGTAVLAAAGAFDRDGCGSGPYSTGAQNQQACVADLTRIRSGVSTLLEQTHGIGGTGG